MKEIRLFMNEYMFLANVLLFLCYLQSNLLMFRLLFTGACLFLLIFSLSGDIISIDTVIFNLLFVIINIKLAIPIIKNLAPPKFTHEQKEIFKNHFRNYLTPIELNVLLKSQRRKIFRVSTPILKKGNEFSSLFFVAKVGKNCSVELKSNKRVFELTENSWVGIPEYLNVISRKESLHRALKDFDTGEWGLSMNVVMEEDLNEVSGDNINNNSELLGDSRNQSRDLSRVDEDNTVIMYEFELSALDSVFSDPSHGTAIMRGLHSIWLQYCSNIVKRVDQSSIAAVTGQSLNTNSYSNRKHMLIPSLDSGRRRSCAANLNVQTKVHIEESRMSLKDNTPSSKLFSDKILPNI